MNHRYAQNLKMNNFNIVMRRFSYSIPTDIFIGLKYIMLDIFLSYFECKLCSLILFIN